MSPASFDFFLLRLFGFIFLPLLSLFRAVFLFIIVLHSLSFSQGLLRFLLCLNFSLLFTLAFRFLFFWLILYLRLFQLDLFLGQLLLFFLYFPFLSLLVFESVVQLVASFYLLTHRNFQPLLGKDANVLLKGRNFKSDLSHSRVRYECKV